MIKIKKFKKLLDKTNNLIEKLSSSGKEVSALERDLIKNYLIKLYELCDQDGKTKKKLLSKSETVELIEAPKSLPVVPPHVENESIKEDPVDTQILEKEKISEIEENGQNSIEDFNPEVFDLFYEKEVSDLSDKLSKIPVDDLNKTMGINEKIFTIQELFNGNRSEFEETISYLNGLKSFEEAREFLMREKAEKYEWASKAHKKKAIHFINQVRRKYY